MVKHGNSDLALSSSLLVKNNSSTDFTMHFAEGKCLEKDKFMTYFRMFTNFSPHVLGISLSVDINIVIKQ